MNEELRERLKKFFSSDDVAKIESFLNREFSENGEIVIASIFGYAKDNQKSLIDVLKECEKEWERNWKLQHPELRANPDAPGGAGKQNRVSLHNIYEALGIPNPIEAGTKNIPEKPFKVRTFGSVYTFGETDKKGERSVSRDRKPLGFSRCRITFLSPGKSMVLIKLDGPGKGEDWVTSCVQPTEK